jgi:Mrp family chromosome partitioning ATPase
MVPVKISRLLELLGQESDVVLIDAPALLSVADPMILASQVNAVILVVALRKTERKNLRFSLQQLNELKAKVVGIVMNRMPNTAMYSYYTNRLGHNGSHPEREKINS